jgi:hypothetical protein
MSSPAQRSPGWFDNFMLKEVDLWAKVDQAWQIIDEDLITMKA